jgi:dihydrolipoamide dehydrogenase
MRIVILGGGPGGHACAFEAARLGADVVLIEKEHLGGTCLNWGCIPTKAILRSARLLHDAKRADEFGIRIRGEVAADVDHVRDRKDGIISELRKQLDATAMRLKIEVVRGKGVYIGERTVEVDGVRYTGDALILATGSAIFKLPSIDHSLPGVWTSDEGVAFRSVPAEVLLIGGGVIGLEFACAYASFGSKVTVV